MIRRYEPVQGRWPWPVYRGGEGPPVILIHELMGLTDSVLDFADRLVAAGFTVWLPVLAGPAPAAGLGKARAVFGICVSKEIHLLRRGETSPVAGPLRELARDVAEASGVRGVGVVGMCFSGGFALAMAADEAVLAGVAAQQSLPLPVPPSRGGDLGLSPGDVEALRARLASGETEIYVTRFTEDRMSSKRRVPALRACLGEKGVTVDEIPSGPGNPDGFGRKDHAVLTVARRRHEDGPGGARLRRACDDVVAFLHRRLG